MRRFVKTTFASLRRFLNGNLTNEDASASPRTLLHQKNSKRVQTNKLRIETLEDRALLSAVGNLNEVIPFETNNSSISSESSVLVSEMTNSATETAPLCTTAEYNAHDLAVVTRCGLSGSSRFVEWDENGRLISLSISEHSLTGTLDLSNCSALASLDCYGNDLTEINLSGCSALQVIWCGRNSLTNLDVTDCVALEALYCDYGSLETLDVSGCSALQTLYCNNNALTSLNLSNCVALEGLYCNNNALTELDISSCSGLVWLCACDNALSTLDISSCSYLQTLRIAGNDFSSLDLSGGNLTQLDVARCAALETLDCSENNIVNLNLSQCYALTNLQCSHNTIASLTVAECVLLEKLDFCDNIVPSIDLVHNAALRELYCPGNRLTKLNASACPQLEICVCSDNMLTEFEFAPQLTLRTFNCSNNPLTSLNVSSGELESLDVSNCEHLVWMDCSDNELVNLNVSGCDNLIILKCQNNNFSDFYLQEYDRLEYLDASFNDISELDVSGCVSLRYLDCRGNLLYQANLNGCSGLMYFTASDTMLRRVDVSDATSLESFEVPSGIYSIMADENQEFSVLIPALYENETIVAVDANEELATAIRYGATFALEVNAADSPVAISRFNGSETAYHTFHIGNPLECSVSLTKPAPGINETVTAVLSPGYENATYQWYRVNASGKETAISGAASASYKVVAADVGYYLRVVVTVDSKEAYVTTDSVATRPLSSISLNASGTSPTVGTKIISYISPSGGKATYQWYRINAKGVETAIEGATASSYVPVNDDCECYLRVEATGKDGYLGVVSKVTPNPLPKRLDATLSSSSPAYNRLLRVTLKQTKATVTYQWYRGATTSVWKPIDGATKSSYLPTADDVGNYLKVVITGTDDYEKAATSVATASKVTRALVSVALPTTVKFNTTLTAALSPNSATATYQWYRGSDTDGWTAISNATSKKYVPTAADVGKYLKVVVTGTGNFTGVVSKKTVSTVTRPLVSVTLTATVKEGVKIGAYINPGIADSTATYKWYRGSGANGWNLISGASGKTYVPTASDVGYYLRVVVTADGYTGSVKKVTSTTVKANVSVSSEDAFVGYDALLDNELDAFWDALDTTVI